MHLKVKLVNDYELYINLGEVAAWRPYDSKFDLAEHKDMCIIDMTNGGTHRLNKESSIKFIAVFESGIGESVGFVALPI